MPELEERLLARGVKFCFIIKQDIREEEHSVWQEMLSRSSPLSSWFRRVVFECSDHHPGLAGDWQGWNLVKVFFTEAGISVKPSEAKSFYEQIFVRFSEWFIEICQDRRIECKPYDFRILFRLHPPESASQFVPIPPLDGVCAKLLSQQNALPTPPVTLTDMHGLARETVSDRTMEELLKYVEKHRLTLFGDYGIRREERSDVCQFYILVPDQPEEAESMQRLQGKLSHELILYSRDTALSDFEGTARIMLSELLHNGVIDSQRVEEILGNPDNHFVTGQGHTRLTLDFDIKELGPQSELGRALDATKKDLQRKLEGTPYSLYGAVSYTLTDADLERIETVLDDIVHFRNASRDVLYVRLSMLLVAGEYEGIVEVARRVDEIMISHMALDLTPSPPIPTDIEDAKKRWKSAESELTQDGRKADSYLFWRDVSAIPLQAFLAAREPMCNDLNGVAAWTHIGVTITSDSFQHSKYGCYVAGS